ncbi:MAG TPA: hypothetical protein VLH79_02925 [Chthonomonadales bacterium]|nr:hypothetical protein [Chthonomonadales bacterium]
MSAATLPDGPEAIQRVKSWMAASSPEEYTTENIRRLLAVPPPTERSAADHAPGHSTCSTCSVCVGILEFASEEIARLGSGDDAASVRAAWLETRRAMALLPDDPAGALDHLWLARALIRETVDSRLARRALRALRLASDMVAS